MRWLCWFRDCRWLHVANTFHPPEGTIGLYQCRCCKTLSVGAPR